MAMLATLAGSDFRLSARFHSWKPPRWFRIWMHWASRMGDGWIWLAIAPVPFVVDRRPIFSALAFPALSPFVMVLAGSIALSRVTQGFHFIGDVLAGTTIGTVIGAGSFWILVG